MAKSKKVKEDFPTHQIRSFDDLMAVITKENVDMIMGNFYGVIVHWLKVLEKYPDCKLTGFDWIDDGKLEIRPPNITVSQTFKMALKKDEDNNVSP